MVDIELTRERAMLIMDALSTIYQIDSLGFTEKQRELALEIQEEIECALDEYNELDFNE